MDQRRLVLLCATAAGDEARRFDEAAAPLGVELVLTTADRDRLDAGWRGRAVVVPSGEASAACAAVLAALGGRRLDGLLALDDRAAVLAASVAERCGLPWHDVEDVPSGGDAWLLHDRTRRHGAAEARAAGAPASGDELTLAGILDHGWLQMLAVLDGGDVLDTAPVEAGRSGVLAAVARAARAAGLWHGPVSARCRVGEGRVVVCGVSPCPVHGSCAHALRFEDTGGRRAGLEALLLRAAIGESPRAWRLQTPAAAGGR